MKVGVQMLHTGTTGLSSISTPHFLQAKCTYEISVIKYLGSISVGAPLEDSPQKNPDNNFNNNNTQIGLDIMTKLSL